MGFSSNARRDALEDLVQALHRVDDAWASYCHKRPDCEHEIGDDRDCVPPPADLEDTLARVREHLGAGIFITTSDLTLDVTPDNVKKLEKGNSHGDS